MVKRLWKHLVSILGSALLNVLGNILLVPLFLSQWSLATYGEWGVMSSVTCYLTTLDFGIGSAVTNRMLASFVKDDTEDYARSQHSAMAFYTGLAVAGTALTGLAVAAFPVSRWVGVKLTPPSEAAWVIWLLGLQVLWALPFGLIVNTYRTIGEPSRTQWIQNLRYTLWLAASALALLAGGNMKTLALWQLAPWLVIMGGVIPDLSRRAPHLLPGLSHASLAVVREIMKPSAMFTVILVAMAVTQQGSVQIISITLGSVAVTVFLTARTLTNIAMQSVNIIKSAAWPDLTILFANQEWTRLRKLLRLLITVSLTICIAIAAALFFEGPEVLKVWTHKPLHVDRLFFGLFLMYVVLQSPWMICSGLLAAVNRHHRLAVSYVASSVIGIVLAALLAPRLGLAAVPLGLMLGEVLACYHFVVKDACDLVGEPYAPFAGRLWLGMALVLVPTIAAGWLAHQVAWGPNVLRWLEVGAATTVEAVLMAWCAVLDVEGRTLLIKRAGVLIARRSAGRRSEPTRRTALVAAAREDEGVNLVGR